jgi:hypothetical protein
MPRRKQPAIPDALPDQLLGGADPKTAFDPDGMLDALKKALAERRLNAEMDQHLSSEAAEGRPNSRNGYGQKTVLTEIGGAAPPGISAQVAAALPGRSHKPGGGGRPPVRVTALATGPMEVGGDCPEFRVCGPVH